MVRECLFTLNFTLTQMYNTVCVVCAVCVCVYLCSYSYFVKQQGLEDDQCLVLSHHKPTAGFTESTPHDTQLTCEPTSLCVCVSVSVCMCVCEIHLS